MLAELATGLLCQPSRCMDTAGEPELKVEQDMVIRSSRHEQLSLLLLEATADYTDCISEHTPPLMERDLISIENQCSSGLKKGAPVHMEGSTADLDLIAQKIAGENKAQNRPRNLADGMFLDENLLDSALLDCAENVSLNSPPLTAQRKACLMKDTSANQRASVPRNLSQEVHRHASGNALAPRDFKREERIRGNSQTAARHGNALIGEHQHGQGNAFHAKSLASDEFSQEHRGNSKEPVDKFPFWELRQEQAYGSSKGPGSKFTPRKFSQKENHQNAFAPREFSHEEHSRGHSKGPGSKFTPRFSQEEHQQHAFPLREFSQHQDGHSRGNSRGPGSKFTPRKFSQEEHQQHVSSLREFSQHQEEHSRGNSKGPGSKFTPRKIVCLDAGQEKISKEKDQLHAFAVRAFNQDEHSRGDSKGPGNKFTPRELSQEEQCHTDGNRNAKFGSSKRRPLSQNDHRCRPSRGTFSESVDYPTLLSSLGQQADKQREKYWQSIYLDCMIAAGDVLAVAEAGQMTRIGAAGGMFGHVLLVTAVPQCIQKHTPEGARFLAVWPAGKVREIYQVPVIESTRSAEGIHETDLLLYVEPKSCKIILLGEVDNKGSITEFANDAPEEIELWQCPPELRDSSCRDIKEAVIEEMKENQANWSWYTAVRAFLLPAADQQTSVLTAPSKSTQKQFLKEVQDCWNGAPICSSLPVIFWQRYLFKLSQSGRASDEVLRRMSPIEMIMTYMPLKSDRSLPGELLKFMQASGWKNIQHLSKQMSALNEPMPRWNSRP